MVLRRKHRKEIIKRLYNVLRDKRFEGTYINRITAEPYTLVVNLHLPEGKELADLEKILPNLQQEMMATAIKAKPSGKDVQLKFGMRELGEITFDESMLTPDTLKLWFPSAYGETVLDFEDGASCHMLNGGVTRMGKTSFLLYLATSVFMQNKGNVGLYISSVKLKDYYPFENIPQVRMERDTDGMIDMLEEIMDEYKKRDAMLYSPRLQKATDAKSVRNLYPEHYHLFKPIFLIIDEYARFAESKEIQNMVTEIVETAGFVNVHVIIASQRPDASTVLRPRIRANLLVRMAFTTADRKNSEVILDREGAEKLGKIAGRAMLNDGGVDVIQVPFLDTTECDKLLEGYRNEQSTKRYIGDGVIDEIQGHDEESTSLSDLLGEFKPGKRGQSGTEKDVLGWEDFTGTEGSE